MHYSSISKTIQEVMDEIGDYYLPAIQREFVWEPEKIERFFDSLLRGYPVGTLLFWKVREPAVHEVGFYELVRDYDSRKPHNKPAVLHGKQKCTGILDGQQRITALLIGLRGSYTRKTPRKRWSSPDAFPEKKLYMDLLYEPNPEDPEDQYRVKFLTPADAIQNNSEYWYEVGKILNFRTRDQLYDFRQGTAFRENPTFEKNLDRLHSAIVDGRALTYFEETRQDLDEVLEIFVRLNTGGTPLSYSDLLLSLSTASWERDARNLVYKLVDALNQDYGATFRFDKDLVLKTLLVFSGKDVRFRLKNFSAKAGLEGLWDSVEKYLRLTVSLVADFGFDRETLSSHYVIVPIAYYLHRRGLDRKYLGPGGFEHDRDSVKLWLVRMLLKGAFGGNSDTVLTRAREAIDELWSAGKLEEFPGNEINSKLKVSQFTEEEVQSLVTETWYGSPDAFQVLTLLYPTLDYQSSSFHIDHIHPRSSFTEKGLRAAGMKDHDIGWAMGHFDALPNLQLLQGKANQAKLATPFEEWLRKQKDVELFKSRNYIPEGSLKLVDFKVFFEARKEELVGELRSVLRLPHS